MDLKTQDQNKNRTELPFPEPQGGPERDEASLERRERVLAAVAGFYRQQKRRKSK